MDLIDIYKKIQYSNANIAAGTLTIFLVSTIAILLSPYTTSLVAAHNTEQNASSNITPALPTSTAVQKNATAESIAKATGTNSTGITGLILQVT
jgi:hypothetical protein